MTDKEIALQLTLKLMDHSRAIDNSSKMAEQVGVIFNTILSIITKPEA